MKKSKEKITPEKQVMFHPWPKLTYQETMDRFGKDAPDMRFGMELVNIGDWAADCGFSVFENAIKDGGSVRGIPQVHRRRQMGRTAEDDGR